MVRAGINFCPPRLLRDFQDMYVNIVQKSFVEVMHLHTSGDFSMKKGHKLLIRRGCEGMSRINGLLLLLEYPELIGKQKDSQCFNLSNKKLENGQNEGADTTDHVFFPGCHDFCCLVWIVYQFYASLPNISILKTLMVGGSLEKNSKLRSSHWDKAKKKSVILPCRNKDVSIISYLRGCIMDIFPISKYCSS